jgi:hypothetical protein
MAKTETARKRLVIPTDRIAALHAEIDEIVARHVDAVAKECGSIPEGVIKQIEGDAFGRAGFCHCKAARFQPRATHERSFLTGGVVPGVRP